MHDKCDTIAAWTRRLKPTLCLLAAAVTMTAGWLRASDEIPGAPQKKPIALVGGTVHTMTGEPLRDATVVFDRGKIVAVGQHVAIPAGAEKIDVHGKLVFPGLIDSFTSLGLVEINSVKGTVDEAEIGEINANVCTWVAVNPDSELIPVTRTNGVLAVLTVPQGGLVAGRSGVIQLDGWTNDEMTLAADVAMHVRWPRMAPVHTWRLEESAESQLAKRDATLRELRTTFDQARAYWHARRAAEKKAAPMPAHDQRWEALGPVLDGRQPVIVNADELQQIQSAIAWANEYQIKIIIAGGYDAPRCTELLKQHKVPVIVTGVNRLPQRRDDPYDTPFTVPAQLHKAGVTYCLAGLGRMGNIRNLPYHAATAVAFGLSKDEAYRAITINAAQILGVADRIGSLEAGKDATLFVASGDPLEIPTNLTAAYIQGRPVDLSNRQTKLWQKYEEKYRRLGEQARP